MADAEPQTPLQYESTKASRARLRRLARWVIAAGLLAVLFVAWGRGEALVGRATRMYWAWRCWSFEVPADKPMVFLDPQEVRVAIGDGNTDYAPRRIDTDGLHCAAVFEPLAFRRLLPQTTKWYPDGYDISWPAPRVTADEIIFLGGRTTPSGTRRLIVMRAHNLDSTANRFFSRVKPVEVLPDVRWNGDVPRPIAPPKLQSPRPNGTPLSGRALSAARHPTDPTCIVVILAPNQYHQPGSLEQPPRTTVHAYLQDDDTLRWEFADPPATQAWLGLARTAP